LITVRNAVALSTSRTTSEYRAPSGGALHTGGATSPIVPMEEVERRAIIAALMHTRGNVSLAARLLQLGRATLYRKISQYGIDPTTGRP
jgi:transcriptional regulator of acetoin/glycerol metabolism